MVLIPFFIVFLGSILIPLILILAIGLTSRWLRKRDRRRSPLTGQLLHLPGQQCRDQADKAEDERSDRLAHALMVGPMIVAGLALLRVDFSSLRLNWVDWVLIIFTLALIIWQTLAASRLAKRTRQFRQGADAEAACAQQLNPLIAQGCDLYHDVPAQKFNIDHIVVGPDCVYAIETKSRLKPDGKGRGGTRVSYDGKKLQFPGWPETEPLDQAESQARWLRDLLYRKTGTKVRVVPVLALPGWYVVTTVPNPPVHVINPAMNHFMAKTTAPSIPDDVRRRVKTAIEECYPPREP